MRTMSGIRAVGVVLVVAAITVGCSSNDGVDASGRTTTDPTTAATAFEVRTPDGPAAVIGGPLEGGKGTYLVAAGPGPSLDDAGFTEAEYSASGTATSYQAASLPTD